ncbi:MAG: prolipoprotein diacylglyceryl transferase [Gammaproteobacteria bacterium]|nr:prolipoprotein diacylglyceryl transferase [Gammaproteobacteria bacterium]
MLPYPNIDPVIFSIGPLHIRWYGLMYIVGFAAAFGLAHWRVKRQALDWTSEQISDLIFFAAVGVIVGGRLGYFLFYQTTVLVKTPWVIFKLWEGGMSFHGGLLGVIIAMIFFASRRKKSAWEVIDFAAPLAPFGLAAGRLGNFINGELWGRVTDVSWAMVFPSGGPFPRHPSQLYEMGLEGFGLLIVLLWYTRVPRPSGTIAAVFIIGYSICRFVIEFFREPDLHLGFVAFGWLTMGQLLSIPMFLIGLLLWWLRRHADLPKTH